MVPIAALALTDAPIRKAAAKYCIFIILKIFKAVKNRVAKASPSIALATHKGIYVQK
jgi:hypothetical protein